MEWLGTCRSIGKCRVTVGCSFNEMRPDSETYRCCDGIATQDWAFEFGTFENADRKQVMSDSMQQIQAMRPLGDMVSDNHDAHVAGLAVGVAPCRGLDQPGLCCREAATVYRAPASSLDSSGLQFYMADASASSLEASSTDRNRLYCGRTSDVCRRCSRRPEEQAEIARRNRRHDRSDRHSVFVACTAEIAFFASTAPA